MAEDFEITEDGIRFYNEDEYKDALKGYAFYKKNEVEDGEQVLRFKDWFESYFDV